MSDILLPTLTCYFFVKINSMLPSNRKFGFLIAAVFFTLSVYSFLKTGITFRVYSNILISFLFLFASFKNSELLTPLNKAWFLLGQVLGKVVSPIVLGGIFFLLITPIGLITRLFGRDELKLKRTKRKTYWREPIGSNSDSESFRHHF